MRFIKNIMSRKLEAEEMNGAIDLDMDVEPLRRDRPRAEADDSGQINPSASSQEDRVAEAKRLFGLEGENADAEALPDPAPEVTEFSAEDDADWDDDDAWDDDEDWGDDWDAPEDENEIQEESKALKEKAHLVEEIREAMGAVKHVSPDEMKVEEAKEQDKASSEKDWAMDEEFGRKAIARKELGVDADASEERLLEEANWKLGDDESSRRRSALLHLKAAAKATKADRVLSSVVARDPASDPEEQSPYRADLAKVVRPRPTSRPAHLMSRPAPLDEPAQASPMAAKAPMENEDHVADASGNADMNADENAWMNLEPDFSAEPTQTASTIAAESAERAWEKPAADADPAQSPKIWDLEGEAGEEGPAFDTTPAPVPESKPVERSAPVAAGAPAEADAMPGGDLSGFAVPAPASGRSGRSAGRVKTRLLGFQGGEPSRDPFAAPETTEEAAPVVGQPAMFPVGWIVVTEGPGRGASFTLFNGVSQIGRGDDQAIKLDFGDTAVSRQNHAAVAYDEEQKTFFLGHGGKSNLVRLNDRPVLSTEELKDGDLVRIGETTLRFIALCKDDFGWDNQEGDGDSNAIHA